MDKRTLTNLLLLILIVLVLFGLYKITSKNKIPNTEENTNTGESVVSFDWAKFNSKQLADIVSRSPGADFDPTIPLEISKIVDLTGDGETEAVVVGSGGNNE